MEWYSEGEGGEKKGGKRGLGGEEWVAPVWELWGRLAGNARQPRTRRWHRRGSHLSDLGKCMHVNLTHAKATQPSRGERSHGFPPRARTAIRTSDPSLT